VGLRAHCEACGASWWFDDERQLDELDFVECALVGVHLQMRSTD
jgi:hypothetical protein